ncbi:hypothetical protein GJ496_007782 [Pomphorhynchus laevis]|nr:hypothetical protein GJ496_007782 [Pomphorhynchus laevis]
MLFLIGIGLCNPSDITVRGLEIVRKCEFVYLEIYTSLSASKSDLEIFYGVTIISADRQMIEEQADEILQNAKDNDVAILVIGDPLSATTHIDLIIRARQMGIKTDVVHNASIFNAIAITGLQLYRFGETVSIPFSHELGENRTVSFVEKIVENKKRKLHTLCLLDIRVNEVDWAILARDYKKVTGPPRFMTIKEAIELIIEASKLTNNEDVLNEQSLAVGVARLGASNQYIGFQRLSHLRAVDFGSPLHSLVILGDLHHMEKEYLEMYSIDIK